MYLFNKFYFLVEQNCFDVLLTAHFSIILATDQLNAQILVFNKFNIFLYMF